MSIIRCPECSQRVSSLAGTCPHCGVSIRGNIRQCPHCNEYVMKSATVCPHCSTPLEPMQEPVANASVAITPNGPSTQPNSPKPKKKGHDGDATHRGTFIFCQYACLHFFLFCSLSPLHALLFSFDFFYVYIYIRKIL